MSNTSTLSDPKTRLYIRNATLADVPAICALSARVYADAGCLFSQGQARWADR